MLSQLLLIDLLQPTLSSDAHTSTAITIHSPSLAALLTSTTNAISDTEQTRSHPNSFSPFAKPPHATSSPARHVSIGLDGRTDFHNATAFMPATEASSSNVVDDGVPGEVPNTSESSVLSCDSSPLNSHTASSPLERSVDQISPLSRLLEALEREQLEEIHARGGFAGFTAQEIEGWVAADRV